MKTSITATTTDADRILEAVYAMEIDAIGRAVQAVPRDQSWAVRGDLREALSVRGQQRISDTSTDCHPSYDPRPWADREIMRFTGDRAREARARHAWAGRMGHVILHALALRSGMIGSDSRMWCLPDSEAGRILAACGV